MYRSKLVRWKCFLHLAVFGLWLFCSSWGLQLLAQVLEDMAPISFLRNTRVADTDIPAHLGDTEWVPLQRDLSYAAGNPARKLTV